MRSAIRFASAGLALAALALARRRCIAADTPNPAADAKAFQKFFTDKFPKVKLEDFVNGPYSMNEDLHQQWEEKEQFPPYEFSLEHGQGDVREAVQERQELRRLLPEQGHRHPPELSLFRRRRKARSSRSSWR